MRSFIIVLENHSKSTTFAEIAINSAREQKWNLEVFKAVDGRQLPINYLDSLQLYPRSNKKFKKQFERPGVVGCFLSHYTLWNKCIEINEPIGIFEEDVIFLAPPLDNFEFSEILKFEKKKLGKNYGTGEWWQGAYAYLITPLAAKKLVSWSLYNGILPADVMLGTEIVDIKFLEKEIVTLNEDSLANNNAMSTTQNLIF